MFKTFNRKITEADDKRLFLASWPGENIKPEVWTIASVEEDFGGSDQIMDMILSLRYNDELFYEEGNLSLIRIPSFLKTCNKKLNLI